jgi:ATP-dependent Clp protease ATP-binding subunit ClpB
LKQTIRPEFLNRIDETIMFTPLNEQQIRDIVGLQIDGVHKMLMQSGIDLRITDDAIDYIAHEGYDPQFGARPVKRALQRLVLNELSKAIIAGKVDHQKPVIVELRDGELQFKN